ELMLRYSGCPKGALASFTCVPTYHSSAVRRRYATPTCHSPAPMKLVRCPPKLGDVKRTGIQPCPNAPGGGARMTATMPSAARHRLTAATPLRGLRPGTVGPRAAEPNGDRG